MKILSMAMLALFLCSCSAAPVAKDPDPFTTIAMDWRGAQIDQMIRVWGAPRELQQYSPGGGGGKAMWQVFGGGDEERSRCSATAWFDASGVITFVETVSQNCVAKRGQRAFQNLPQLKRYPN